MMSNIQNKKVMLAVVIVVLLVLGGVTYWYFSRNRDMFGRENEQPQPVYIGEEITTTSVETSTPSR